VKNVFLLLFLCFTSTLSAQSGEWIEKSNEVEGKWEIVKTGDTYYLLFDEDFDTKKAPDLKIFLSPLEASKITADNAMKDSVKIADLKSYERKQRFAIPKSVNLSAYNTLLIHCQEYGVLWSVAKLR
jgi:hypothetical protein